MMNTIKKPNPELLKFLRSRMAVVDELMDNLKPDDEYLINRILDKNDVLRKLLGWETKALY